jgi:heme/copper-type cytochrome/quinol oxidase subunit 1
LLIGSGATALFVRHGSRFFAGMLAGAAGFWVGVMPYMVLTAPSDVSFADAFGFAVIVFAPAILFVAAGAATGAGLRRLFLRL